MIRRSIGFTMTSTSPPSPPPFSLAEARGIVGDLFAPRPWIYWADFLASIVTGYVAFGLTRWLHDIRLEPLWLRLLLQAATFSVQCACFYRAVMFNHEIAHLPERRFRAFRVAWNLFCGIPFLVPSFTYATHLEHHRRHLYGTRDDGEYLPLASLSPWYFVLYLSQCLWIAPLAVVRFGLLTPLAWLSPRLRRLIDQRASSLVMDARHLRPLPTAAERWQIRLQELGCLLYLAGCLTVPPLVWNRPLIVLAIHAYVTSVVLVLFNSLRTLAAHRYTSDGHEETFLEQLLDSITLDNDSLAAVIVNPVGLRYHSTHHLFPSLPYHNLRAAHRRLLEQLPADSPYRLTVERSLLKVIGDLWRHATARAGSESQVATAYR